MLFLPGWGSPWQRRAVIYRTMGNRMTFRPLGAWFAALGLYVLVAAALPAMAQDLSPDTNPAPDIVQTKRVEARLVSEIQALPADGGRVTIALRKAILKGWHTYWRNAGDSGEPTRIEWSLPEGFKAGEVQWPLPERIPIGPLMNYGYSGDLWLLSELTVPKGLEAGSSVTLKANVTWLVCKETCIPEQGSFQLKLAVADGSPKRSDIWAAAFEDARKRLPETGTLPARFEIENDALILNVRAPEGLEIGQATFFPFVPGVIKNAAAQDRLPAVSGVTLRLAGGSKVVNADLRAKLDAVEGLLVVTAQGRERGIPISAVPGQITRVEGLKPPEIIAPSGSVGTAPGDPVTLLTALGFALLGGLILNLMPCVFPVLSMKALALVKHRGLTRAAAIQDGLSYTGGVMITFMGLAGAVLALRAAGEGVGWGFQLQSPIVVAALIYILFAVGLNLSGVFTLGGGLMGLAGGGNGEERSGPMQAFMTGVLAVIVAAPCTVPFMGAAVGFALTQSPVVTLAVFAALGLGLALPWLIVSAMPELLSTLPAPGPWMERLKEFLAFPMYLSAAWLLWVLAQQTDANGLFRVLIGLVLVAFVAYAWGRMQASTGRSIAMFLLVIVSIGLSIAMIAAPFPERGTTTASASAPKLGPDSEPFSPDRLADLRREGKAVFVNFTAAWCITCLFNEQVAMQSQATADAFKETGTAYLKGDWTNRDPVIANILRTHGRDGVPLYLYYPPGQGDGPHKPLVLPEVLTQDLVISTIRNKGP